MRKWTIIYFLVGLLWSLYCLNTGGGEPAIAPFLITTILTLPIGLVLWPIGHIIPWTLIVPVALVLNYFQWVVFIRLFKKISSRRLKVK